MTRLRAAGIHLAISALIALSLFSLVFLLWYPEPYFEAAGAQFLWYLLVGIDIILGPFLTLLVFKPGKPGLKFDLVFIALVQFAALVYGFSVVAQARPAFVVFAVDRFNVVPANWVKPESLNMVKQRGTYPQFASLPWTGPILVAAQLPKDPAQRQALMFSALEGYDVETHPEFFVPYLDQAEQVLAKALPLEHLFERNPEAVEHAKQIIAKTGYELDQVCYLPLTASRRDMVVLLDAESAAVITTLPIDPWGL